MRLLCRIGLHNRMLLPSHVSTIENGKHRTWVVMACDGCKTFKRIGMAHESDTQEPDRGPKNLPEGWRLT